MSAVPFPQFFAARCELARLCQFSPDALDAIVLDLLSVMGRVRLAGAAIKIAFAHNLRSQAGGARDTIDDLFNNEHPLRPAESAKGSVRREIGFHDSPAEFAVRNVVAVIEVKQCPVRDGPREIERPAAVREQIDLRREEQSGLVKTDT